MQRPGVTVFAASPSTIRHFAPRLHAVRPVLPDKNVNNDTIEEAYVNFILYCNPAVSQDADTAALREAFRTPPKSEGKSFNTYTLFELIKRLESKELKTWAELALKLGVEPPDQDKRQSSQKIQQYAVRLKVNDPSPSPLPPLRSVDYDNLLTVDSDGCIPCTLTPSSSTYWGG
jgi:hypothetical protein